MFGLVLQIGPGSLVAWYSILVVQSGSPDWSSTSWSGTPDWSSTVWPDTPYWSSTVSTGIPDWSSTSSNRVASGQPLYCPIEGSLG